MRWSHGNYSNRSHPDAGEKVLFPVHSLGNKITWQKFCLPSPSEKGEISAPAGLGTSWIQQGSKLWVPQEPKALASGPSHPQSWMIKTPHKVGREGTYLNITKVIYDKFTANILLNG